MFIGKRLYIDEDYKGIIEGYGEVQNSIFVAVKENGITAYYEIKHYYKTELHKTFLNILTYIH